MLKRTTYSTVLTAILSLLIVLPVAAHGDEESAAATFTDETILTVSLITAVVVGLAFVILPAIKLRPIQLGIAALVVMTAVVHLMAGVDEFILLLNGLGYPVILAAIYFMPIRPFKDIFFKPFKSFKGILYWLLIGYTTITIASFFVIHPWGIEDGALDWLGVVTKAAEVVLIALVLVDWWQHRHALRGVPTKLTHHASVAPQQTSQVG